MKLSNKQYDIAQWFVRIFLPAFATFYIALGALAEVPGVELVAGVCTAFAVFLGTVLGISSKSYEPEVSTDGDLNIVQTGEDSQTWNLELDKDLLTLADQSVVSFKVNKPSER